MQGFAEVIAEVRKDIAGALRSLALKQNRDNYFREKAQGKKAVSRVNIG
ncbi:hypothetical protein [Coleofasciculus sp. FACHB-1120]|nr:hypothetical protein [Coleofasciculus sp. FACHB-1120]MBD2740822.1 hypothetical protein [Coleofasciculus sp. FACHB-1120]